MKKLIFLTCILVFAANCLFAANEAIKPDGEGTAESPYVLTRIENLVWMGDNMKDCRSSVFCLGNDIDCSETKYWESPFVSIGWPKEMYGQAYNFLGVLDGKNYTIKNLYSKSADGLIHGLWGAEIKNLYLDNMNLGSFSSGARGGLTQTCNDSVVSNVHVSGQISGSGDCGGIFSHVYSSKIDNCSFIGIINGFGDSTLGGIASFADYSTLIFCKASGFINNINGASDIGGICGLAVGAPDFNDYCIRYCIADMKISAKGNIGGIVAQNYMYNVKHYPDGDVLYENCGLINNYSLCVGDVSSADNAGGICAVCSTNCIDIGNFYDKTGISGTQFGIGLSSDKMKRRSSFSNWDFDNVWAIHEFESTPYWMIGGEKPYRVFYSTKFPGTLNITPEKRSYAFNENISINVTIPENSVFIGFQGDLEGTETNISLVLKKDLTIIGKFAKYISSADDFIKIGRDQDYPQDGYYIQTTDLNMSTTDYPVPVSFCGVYDGGNHVISNVMFNNPSRYMGLFSSVSEAKIYNLGIRDVKNNTRVSYFGLMGGGAIASEISNCYISTSVELNGSNYSGGFFSSFEKSQMINCEFRGELYSSVYFGGLTYFAAHSSFEGCSAEIFGSSNISKDKISGLMFLGTPNLFLNCYVKGDCFNYAFTAPTSNSELTFSNCYAFAESECVLEKANYINCYFNSNCVEQVEGVTGFVSEEEMKKQETYAGWDFDEIWDIDDGVGTPYFRYAVPEPVGMLALLLLALAAVRKR